jgi:hypothetical protein
MPEVEMSSPFPQTGQWVCLAVTRTAPQAGVKTPHHLCQGRCPGRLSLILYPFGCLYWISGDQIPTILESGFHPLWQLKNRVCGLGAFRCLHIQAYGKNIPPRRVDEAGTRASPAWRKKEPALDKDSPVPGSPGSLGLSHQPS